MQSSSLYAQEKPQIDIRVDDATGDVIIGSSEFKDLWAYLLFLEGRVTDLKSDKESLREANKSAIEIADKSIEQVDRLIIRIKTMETKQSKASYTVFELVLITSLGILAGLGAGLLIIGP